MRQCVELIQGLAPAKEGPCQGWLISMDTESPFSVSIRVNVRRNVRSLASICLRRIQILFWAVSGSPVLLVHSLWLNIERALKLELQ